METPVQQLINKIPDELEALRVKATQLLKEEKDLLLHFYMKGGKEAINLFNKNKFEPFENYFDSLFAVKEEEIV
jgi:hypothetical protein